ncbi:MAG: zinc ABC transporter substrate-binding protein [Thermodesulfobacteriota bacterium]
MNILQKVKALNLPTDQYVLVGGGVLAAHKIREAPDIDLVVTQALFDEMKRTGEWREGEKPNGGPALYKDEIEVYLDVNCDSYNPTTQELIERAESIEGIQVISLHDLLKFKRGYGRPKDRVDIELIEKVLAK